MFSLFRISLRRICDFIIGGCRTLRGTAPSTRPRKSRVALGAQRVPQRVVQNPKSPAIPYAAIGRRGEGGIEPRPIAQLISSSLSFCCLLPLLACVIASFQPPLLVFQTGEGIAIPPCPPFAGIPETAKHRLFSAILPETFPETFARTASPPETFLDPGIVSPPEARAEFVSEFVSAFLADFYGCFAVSGILPRGGVPLPSSSGSAVAGM